MDVQAVAGGGGLTGGSDLYTTGFEGLGAWERGLVQSTTRESMSDPPRVVTTAFASGTAVVLTI